MGLGEVIISAIKSTPKETHEEYMKNLPTYMNIIDRTPDKFLQYHLDNAVRDERYELAQYIKDRMDG
jgi:hypothetical protein